MALDITAYVGYYLVCHTTTKTVTTSALACSGNPDHNFDLGKPYCPMCGAKITELVFPEQQEQTMSNIMCGADDDWCKRLTQSEIDYINEHCLCLDRFSCDADDGIDIVLIEGAYAEVDAHHAGTHNIDIDVALQHPPTVQIITIRDIMQYSEVEIKFGMIIAHT